MRQEAVDLRERYEHLLRAIVAEGVARGEFRAVDAAMTGRAVLSMLNWMARWFHPGGPKTAPEFARVYVDLLLGGLLQEPNLSGGPPTLRACPGV